MSQLTNKVRHGDVAGVKASILGGADLSRKDKRGNTPLHIAAEEDDVEIAAVLIAAGAPLDQRNTAGQAPSDVRPGTATTAAIERAIFTQ